MADGSAQAVIAAVMEPQGVRQLVTLLPAAAARPLGYILLLPVFSRFHLNVGYLRGALVVAMILPVMPSAIALAAADPSLLGIGRLPGLMAAEFLVGALLGLLAGMPMWAALAAGDFIDMQRGAQMAQLFDPGSSDQQSVTGTMLVLVCILVLCAQGILIPALFGPLLDSYRVIPMFAPLAALQPAQGALALRLLDTLLHTGLVLALPVMVPLLLIELAVAIATKYMPQLNSTFLAMSVKQAVYALLMVVYATMLAGYAIRLSGSADLRPDALRAFVQGALDPGAPR